MDIVKYDGLIWQVKIGSFFCRLLSFVFLAAGSAGLLGLEGREGSQVDLLLR
jgi:hypothetical protein